MYTCDRCGKGTLVGMNVSHSHRRTKKRSLPNLHKVTLVFGGARRTFWLCTKCLRVVKKQADPRVKASLAAEAVGKATEVKSQKTSSEEVKEETVKVEKTGTLSEAIEKAADKKSTSKKKSTKEKVEV